jgi:hypothetical protein
MNSMTMKERFELQMHSIVAGAQSHWALHAVPLSADTEVERVECLSLNALEILFTKLRQTGLSEAVIVAARKQLVERSATYVLGTYELSGADCVFLGLQSVPGMTRSDVDDLPIEDDAP